MINLSYTVAGQLIETASVPQYLVADTVGVYQVAFTFDSDWADMGEKTVVFRNPQVIDPDYRDVPVEFPLDANGQALVPAALLDPGKLFIGVYGTNSTQQFPTIWAPPLQVVPGASPGVEPSDDPALGTVIRTIPQTLTEEEKAQARENIGANEIEGGTPGNVVIIGSNNNIIDGGFKATEAFPVGSASGGIASFTDGADGVPLKTMTVQIEPIQAGSGGPSPSNVRAITGWTAMPITRTAKNLLGGMKFAENLKRYIPLATIYEEDQLVVFQAPNGVNSTPPFYGITQMPFKENTQYTFIITLSKSSGVSASESNLRVIYTDGSYDNIPNATVVNTKTQVRLVTDAGKTVRYLGKVNSAGTTRIYYNETGIFEGVITADDFVPYNGNTYSIEFPDEAGTVYGGELTVAEDGTGKMYVNMAGVKPNNLTVESPIAHGTASSSKAFSLPISAYPATVAASAKRNSISEISKQETAFYGANRNNQANSYIYAIGTTGNFIRIYDPDLTITDADFMTKYGDRLYIYEIEPVTYDLTASQVSTLLGLNTIWADTGDMSIEYHADPTIFVEQKTRAIKQSIAPIEDGYTASQAYAVGSFLFVGDTLYKVTSAIASGATITPNTNCVATTVAEQLMALA